MVQKSLGHHFLSLFWIQVTGGPVFEPKPQYSSSLLAGSPPDSYPSSLSGTLTTPPPSLCSASLSSDSANAKPGERPTLPIKWWSFPKHCSSYISLVDVWACGWSWSYIHTLASGLFGTQTGHSRTLHTPSAREKRSEYFFFTLQSTENGCFWINVNHLLMCSVICVNYLVKNKAYLYCYIQNLLSF